MPGMYKYSMEIESNVKKLLLDTKELQDRMDTLEGKEYKINLNIDEKKLGNVISNLEKMLDSLGKGTGDFKQFENLSKELSSIVSEVQSLSKAFGKVDDSGAKTLLSSIQNIDKSLSELSQNILHVNKNMSNMGGNTSGAVKQVENITNESKKAASALEDVAKAQAKVNGQKTNISLGDSKEQSTEIDLYHNLEKRKVTYDEIIDKIQTIISLKEKEKSLSKTSDDTKLYQKLYDENDINWAGDTEGTINRISDRLKEIYIKYNGKISLINENDIQEAAYLLDILKGAGESPNLNKSQEKFYQNKKFSNDSLFDNIHVDSQKTGEIDKINTELSETYRWFNQLEGVSLNENIANEIKSLISDMQIGGKNANEYANDLLKIFNIEVGSNSVVEQQNKLQSELKETESQAEKTTMAVKEVSSTASTEQKKDAFSSTEATASVEKTTQAIREENNALDETVSKAKQSASELTKTRDIVSQNWYREKGTVVGKDSKGNDITRDADEFSFVERLKNGQLQTVLATYDEETGKWAEQVINVRTAFEQVEKAIISADNKINSLENDKAKILAAHPGYDVSADEALITSEKNHRGELQKTLDFYATEKEYIFEIEAANKRIAENQQRLASISKKKENLRSVISDEQLNKDWDAAIAENNKKNAENAKQLAKEFDDVWNEANKVNSALNETKNNITSLSQIKELSTQFNDMSKKVKSLNSELVNGKITVSDYKKEVKSLTSEYSKMVDIQQKRDVDEYNANAKANAEAAKLAEAKAKFRQADKDSTQSSVDKALKEQVAAWKNIQSIREKISKTNDSNEIANLQQVKKEYQQNYIEADKILKANSSLYDKENQIAKLEQIRVETNKKIADYQDKQISGYDNRLESYTKKTSGYNATIARFNDGGWTSDTYLKNVQAVKDAVKKYEDLLDNIKAKGGIASEEDVQKLKEYEGEIKKTISTVTNMSAAEKGYNFVSAQKELDKIHKLLNENSNMSSEAKAKIKAYYAEIESGNPSMSLDRIHGEIMKIYNAEVEAGRAGRSFFDTLKNSGFHQIAAQMAGMFGVYDVINVVRQGVNTVRELDEAMTEVRKVSNATETQYTSFRDTISSTAKEIATTNKELLNSSADFLRLGYSLDQASDLAKNATLFVNVGDGVDITEATEDMITAMKAFDIQAKDSIKIVDDYNQIGNQFALSASDIGEAMKRSASALETGNNSFEQSIGLITAMNEIVQNSENTGNSLKVLSLRLRGAKAELEDMQEDTDGLCDSTSKLREQIMSLTGVDIMLDDNTFKSTTDIIKELGAVWDKLSDSSQAATLELIAGKSRANNIAALLKNYQRIDEVMESLGDAEGSAMRENEAIVDSINGRIKVLSATAEEFWKSFIDTDLVKNTVSLLSDMLNILTQIIDKGGALATLGIGGTGVGIGAFIKNFSWLTKSYKTRQSFLVG